MSNSKEVAKHDCYGHYDGGVVIVQRGKGVWLMCVGLNNEYESVILYCPFCGTKL